MNKRIEIIIKGKRFEEIKNDVEEKLKIEFYKPMQGDNIFTELYEDEYFGCCFQNCNDGVSVSCGIEDIEKSRAYMLEFKNKMTILFPCYEFVVREYEIKRQ